mmetsp:Transcript_4482/g.13415  ORF Transcript_4482/g.13415 Transcript_4482/m.13415 type:complete len:356 (-) Transcript_4482:1553-2620(-)
MILGKMRDWQFSIRARHWHQAGLCTSAHRSCIFVEGNDCDATQPGYFNGRRNGIRNPSSLVPIFSHQAITSNFTHGRGSPAHARRVGQVRANDGVAKVGLHASLRWHARDRDGLGIDTELVTRLHLHTLQGVPRLCFRSGIQRELVDKRALPRPVEVHRREQLRPVGQTEKHRYAGLGSSLVEAKKSPVNVGILDTLERCEQELNLAHVPRKSHGLDTLSIESQVEHDTPEARSPPRRLRRVHPALHPHHRHPSIALHRSQVRYSFLCVLHPHPQPRHVHHPRHVPPVARQRLLRRAPRVLEPPPPHQPHDAVLERASAVLEALAQLLNHRAHFPRLIPLFRVARRPPVPRNPAQ